MEIGTPKRIITIAPLEEPLGHPRPVEEPATVPNPVSVPELVPA